MIITAPAMTTPKITIQAYSSTLGYIKKAEKHSAPKPSASILFSESHFRDIAFSSSNHSSVTTPFFNVYVHRDDNCTTNAPVHHISVPCVGEPSDTPHTPTTGKDILSKSLFKTVTFTPDTTS